MGKTITIIILFFFSLVTADGDGLSIQEMQTHRIHTEETQQLDKDKIFVYEDTSNEKEFDYVQSIPDNYYSPLSSAGTLETDKTYWIKFRLQNTSSQNQSFILFTGTNSHEIIYFVRKGQVSQSKSGYLTPAKEREIPLGYPSKVKLNIASQESLIVFVRVQAQDNFDPRFNFYLEPEAVWMEDARSKQLLEGIFTGFLLILSFLGIIFFSFTRKREFLFYGLYTLSTCTYFLNYYGYLELYLFPENPQYLMPLWIMVPLAAVFYFDFARSFLETKLNFPKWHRVLDLFSKVVLIAYGLSVIYLLTTNDAYNSVVVHSVLNIIIGCVTLVFIASIVSKKLMVVRYFVIGTLPLLLIVIYSSYQFLSDLEADVPYVAQVGILLEIIVFSIGISHKIKRDFHNHNITQKSLIIQLTENERLQLSINQELEEKVAERTHLINDQKIQLQKARNEAEEATKAKTEFLSVMSHEIRTPLNAIISLSHLMEIENESEDTQEYIDALKFSAESLHSLINDILDYNKMEAGKIHLESTDFSLIDLLKNICESFKYKASGKGVRLILEIGDHTPDRIVGDPTRLTQIFNNLVSNALKFTHEGNVTISTSLKGVKDDMATVGFKVNDTGIGIPKEKLDEIFEDYEQASRETTRKYGGTGLGLAITKKLIELHGSSIKVNSVEDEGTQFYFDIQFELYDSLQIFENVDESPEGNSLKNVKILVVDDNDMNRLVLKRLFSLWDVECHEASNGFEGVGLANKVAFDLILMDLQMDGMDGFETARRIKKDSLKNQDCRILAMTSQSASDVQDKIEACEDMDDLISKPFEPQDLYQCLKYHLILDGNFI